MAGTIYDIHTAFMGYSVKWTSGLMGDKSKLVQTKNSDDFDEPLSKIFTQCEK